MAAHETSLIPVLVAGIGGASLGTEIVKSLAATGDYAAFGCDISPLAFGHFATGLVGTKLVRREHYVADVLDYCRDRGIKLVVPGGEEPLALLSAAEGRLETAGITLLANASNVVEVCSDKRRLFARLAQIGVPIPKTATSDEEIPGLVHPCVVKPATGSGGSSFVFLSRSLDETMLYVEYLRRNDRPAVVQEYISEVDGEFTVGVLSLPDGRFVGSIALRRLFHTKLSVMMRSDVGLISTGYSQGLIDDFPEVRAACERIAVELGSRGPLNVQGRVAKGVFYPFEINPRFSASTHLRTLAGFNEVDVLVRHHTGRSISTPVIRPGHYLRSLTEVAVPLPPR